MAATPGITSRVVRIVEPSDIRSATLLPSRAPSRISSVMIATASGWLSLSPLARRLSRQLGRGKDGEAFKLGRREQHASPPNSQTNANARGHGATPRRRPKA